jgi:hypothetical protein
MSTSNDIDDVLRDNVIKNDPHSGVHWPDKAEMRAMLKAIRDSGGKAVTKRTMAALNAVTPPDENFMGIVLNDPNPANNGYYSREAGAWVKGRGFPDTFARVSLSGSGAAQTGEVEAGVNPADAQVYFAVVTTANTGAMTLAIGGEAPRPVLNLAGNPLSDGEWTAVVLFVRDGENYRMVIAAGAEAAAAASATSARAEADRAEQAVGEALEMIVPDEAVSEAKLSNSLANALSNMVPSRTVLKALDVERWKGAYLAEYGREGVFMLRSGTPPISDPNEGVFVPSNTAGYYWERVHAWSFDIRWFGAKMDGSTNDGAAIQAAINLAGSITGASGGPRAAVYAPPGRTIRLDQQVNISVPIKIDIRSYIVTALTAGFLFAVNPLSISAAGNSGYDMYFEGAVGPGGAFPASRNDAGLTFMIIRSMIFSRLTVRYLSGFSRDGILCDGTGGAYTGGQQQSILHNTFDLGVVANNGYGFYSISLHAETHQFQGNRVKIQNCLQNFMGIVDGQAGFTAGTSNTYDINAIDNATSVCIDTYCPFNTWYIGFTGAPGTSLRMNGNDCDYNEFSFSNNLTSDIVINDNAAGIHNAIRCKAPSNLPASQAVSNGVDYTNNFGCPISVTVPMSGTGTYQMIITDPRGGTHTLGSVASGGYATFPTLHHGWKWKLFTTTGTVTYGTAVILAA